MVLYAAEGLTNVEVARRLETAPEVVARWRRRFHDERLRGLEDRAPSGRPRGFPSGRGRPGEGIACELPRTQGVPLSRFSRAELHRAGRRARDMLPSLVMLVRVSQPAYRVDLWVFLSNSGIKRMEKVGADGLRVPEINMARLSEVVATWKALHEGVEVEVVDG